MNVCKNIKVFYTLRENVLDKFVRKPFHMIETEKTVSRGHLRKIFDKNL